MKSTGQTNWWVGESRLFYYILSHRIHVCMPYMVCHLPSIYPSFVSINLPYDWIRHGYCLPGWWMVMGIYSPNQQSSLRPPMPEMYPSIGYNKLKVFFIHVSHEIWLVVWLPSIFNFPRNIGFMSSSQWTNSYFSEGFKPPTRNDFPIELGLQLDWAQLRLEPTQLRYPPVLRNLGQSAVWWPNGSNDPVDVWGYPWINPEAYRAGGALESLERTASPTAWGLILLFFSSGCFTVAHANCCSWVVPVAPWNGWWMLMTYLDSRGGAPYFAKLVCNYMYKVVPPQWCLLVYNNYRYNPLINPSYSTYKPT